MLTGKETYARIVSKNTTYCIGGKCAECKKDLHGNDVIRCNIEYEVYPNHEFNGQTIIEPFNLCDKCVKKIENNV